MQWLNFVVCVCAVMVAQERTVDEKLKELNRAVELFKDRMGLSFKKTSGIITSPEFWKYLIFIYYCIFWWCCCCLCCLIKLMSLNVSWQAETSAEAWFSIALHPQKPEGSLGWTAQDGHLDSHTVPELWFVMFHVFFPFQVLACGSPTHKVIK